MYCRGRPVKAQYFGILGNDGVLFGRPIRIGNKGSRWATAESQLRGARTAAPLLVTLPLPAIARQPLRRRRARPRRRREAGLSVRARPARRETAVCSGFVIYVFHIGILFGGTRKWWWLVWCAWLRASCAYIIRRKSTKEERTEEYRLEFWTRRTRPPTLYARGVRRPVAADS